MYQIKFSKPLIVFINILLFSFCFSLKASAADICEDNDNNPDDIKELCEQLEKLELQKEIAAASQAIATAQKDQAASELEQFKATLPNTGIEPLEGTISSDGAFKFESQFIAQKAMTIAASKLRGELKKDLIDKPSAIYIYSQGNNGADSFYSSYQKYDYFHLQYTNLIEAYNINGISIPVGTNGDKRNFFRDIRGNKVQRIAPLAAISSIAGSLIQLGQLFNTNQKITPAASSSVATDSLVSAVYQQLNNEGTNEIYYPALYFQEKQALDAVINSIIELLYLRQQGIEKIDREEDSDNKIANINERVLELLQDIVRSTDEENSSVSAAIVSGNAASTISALAQGYSIFNQTRPSISGNKRGVYILFLNPTSGGNIVESQSLFGGSVKVSGGLIVDYKLYEVNDQPGSSQIRNAGIVEEYIAPQKIDDDFVDNLNSIVEEKAEVAEE